MATTTDLRTVDDFLEGQAGCAYYYAVVLADLSSAAYTATMAFEGDEDAAELVDLCRRVEALVERARIAEADGRTVVAWSENHS